MREIDLSYEKQFNITWTHSAKEPLSNYILGVACESIYGVTFPCDMTMNLRQSCIVFCTTFEFCAKYVNPECTLKKDILVMGLRPAFLILPRTVSTFSK